MPAWTLTEAQAKLAEWKLAETKVAEGQAYSISGAGGTGRMMTRADLGLIAQRIQFYANLVDQLERGGIRVRQGVPA
jgi:hypothetical protein